MRQVAGGQPLVRLDLIWVDEVIGPRKRGVREQFAADAVYVLRFHAAEQRLHRLVGGELYHSNLTDKLE